MGSLLSIRTTRRGRKQIKISLKPAPHPTKRLGNQSFPESCTQSCTALTKPEGNQQVDKPLRIHYRMVYQTFFGLRDVVQPLAEYARHRHVAVPIPEAAAEQKRVAVECCPASVLKKHGLPHQNYKQPKGGPLARLRRQTRHAILAAGLAKWVRIGERHRRAIMRNPGGDALDAVIAAVGALHGVREADHAAIARHDRFPREGRMYV